jgi:hypothetical protein
MIDPLKIVGIFLKLVKQLPGVKNDTPVTNTPGSLNSPVVSTPGNLDSPVMITLVSLDSLVMNTSGSWLPGVFRASIRTGLQKNFLVTDGPGKQDSTMYQSQGSHDSLIYFASAGFFGNQFRLIPQCILHWGVLTPRFIHHWIRISPWIFEKILTPF